MSNTNLIRSVYIAVALRARPLLDKILQTISSICAERGITPMIFVDEYHFAPDQAEEMMRTALQILSSSDLLIAEVSEKAIGVGLEVGYAAAKGIPILYLRRQDAAPSTTVGGVATYTLVYEDDSDLRQQLNEILDRMGR